METMFLSSFFDFLLCLTDQHQITYLSVKCLNPFIITGLFIITAADQKCRTVHCLDSFNCRIRVSSFGIIIIYNAFFLCHIFDSVCNSCKFTDALTDAVQGYSIVVSHCNCGHNVLKIVFSKKLQIFCLNYFDFFFSVLQDDFISIQINSLIQFTSAGEIYHSWSQMFSKLTQNLIFIIQHAYIFCTLILSDQFFHTYILFHCMMTVQMVLCNIQDCRYLWCKLINRFQLKTADFCNSYRIWLHLQCFGSIWGSDIADYKNRLTCILHNFSKKCCCSSFSVCSCDGKHFAVTYSVCQFYLSPYRKPLLIKTLYKWKICRHSGT
mgnify:CR=1 FL=1